MSFGTLLATIGRNILARVEHFTLSFFGALASSLEQNGGQLLIHAAQAAVIAAEQQGGSGSDKLAAAQAAVVASLETNGIPVVMNAVNGAIEAAVANIKAEPGVVAPPEPIGSLTPKVMERATFVASTDHNGVTTTSDLGSVAERATGTMDGGSLGADSVSG